jgi:hypothetical protein
LDTFENSSVNGIRARSSRFILVIEKINYVMFVSYSARNFWNLNFQHAYAITQQIVKVRKFFDVIALTVTLTICLLFRSNGHQPTFMDRHRRRLTCSLRLLARHFTPDGVFTAHSNAFMSPPMVLAHSRAICSSFRSH